MLSRQVAATGTDIDMVIQRVITPVDSAGLRVPRRASATSRELADGIGPQLLQRIGDAPWVVKADLVLGITV
jgi:hypothetical protein